MKIAVLGGTGKMGGRLARHLSKENQVVIGSRDKAKAEGVAKGIKGASGDDYRGAAKWAEVVVVSVPYTAINALSDLSEELAGKLLLSLVNPLKVEGGMLRYGKESGSAAEDLARMLPQSRVATAFNNVPPSMLAEEEMPPVDVLVAADSRETFEEAAKVVRTIPNLRPMYAGPITEAQMVERTTALVINLARLNGTSALATRFVSKKG